MMLKKFLSNYKKNYRCRLCEDSRLTKVIDLGKTPLANSFSSIIKKKELLVPLGVDLCESCFHLQLTHIANPKKMFENYLYVSGTSRVTRNHFKSYSENLKKIFKKNKKIKILDIASNDGTFLKNFKSKKFDCYGIDPAKNLNKDISNKNIKIMTGFFSEKKSSEIKSNYGDYDIITANNVFAHVDNLIDFSKGVKNILNKDGIFVFEVSYLIEVIKRNTFDTIYHEHMSFHSYYPLEFFFKKLDMRVYDYKFTKVQGGSIRFYVCHKNGKFKKNKNLDTLKLIELKNFKINKSQTYKKMQGIIYKKKNRIKKMISQLISQKKTLIGYGAAAKTTTLLNYFGITYKHFKFIVDDNPLKQNKFTPGTKIPIKSSYNIYKANVDYIFLLSWNFSKSIIQKHKKFIKKGGVFIDIHSI
jgi:SAM-dependent methyltransferase